METHRRWTLDEEDGARTKKEEDVFSVETCVRRKMSTEECVTLVGARSCGNYCLLTSAPTSTPLLVSHEESELPSRAGGRGVGKENRPQHGF